MRILDVGCGRNKAKQAIGLDISRDSQADLICNLNAPTYPFKQESFDLVICKQVIEHLPDTGCFLRELCRISRNKARIVIQTPHFSSFMAYGDYQHCHAFSVFFLDKLADKLGFRIIDRKIKFHRSLRRYGINWLANKFPLSYERFWAFIFPAEHLHIELEVLKGNA